MTSVPALALGRAVGKAMQNATVPVPAALGQADRYADARLALERERRIVVPPDKRTFVPLARNYINRITCTEKIEKVVYQQDKGVEIIQRDRDLFLKVETPKAPEGSEFLAEPAKPFVLDLYVFCGGRVFELAGGVEDTLPGQRIVLDAPRRLDTGKRKGQAFEALAAKAMRAAWNMEAPQTLLPPAPDKAPAPGAPGAGLNVLRRFVVEDGGYAVYVVSFGQDLPPDQIPGRLAEGLPARPEAWGRVPGSTDVYVLIREEATP